LATTTFDFCEKIKVINILGNEYDEKTLESFLTIINSENKSVSTQHSRSTTQAESDGDDAKVIDQLTK